jgi:metal-responsive CopG/Arc/MetJ family transcriptional regulator
MATPRTRASRVFTISFPENLAQQVEKIAEEESRTISELFREAFRAYRVDRARVSLEKTRAEVRARTPQIYTEDDIEGFVKEIRSERALSRKAEPQKTTA